MSKNGQKLFTYIFKKNFFIYTLVFFYLTVVFINYTHSSYDSYKKETFKEEISKKLTADETYSFVLNKSCGNFLCFLFSY